MDKNKDLIVLCDEEGNECEFELVEVITVEEKDYALLVPTDNNSDEAYIFNIELDENGEYVLQEIEDDKEFQKVKKAWEEQE
ncbi:MAG: hypothetical protein PWP21_1561 [Thermosediminibacterales bacterium]|nr:hypothetical protein [Thermosediminibacterales bacterium]